jgi:cholesterol oxidase
VRLPDATLDVSRDVAISSSIHTSADTHIEFVTYGPRGDFMSTLFTLLTGDGTRLTRPLMLLGSSVRHPLLFLKAQWPVGWSRRSTILLVMQTLDNSITVSGRRTRLGYRLTSAPGHGAPNPTWIPVGNEVARDVARKIGGLPGGSFGEVANVPMTAHFLGGCAIGDSPETGVIDPYQRLYGHPGLHVVDGSAISANLGVNPSLTITAQSERAMAFWPNKGEADERPAIGSDYQRIKPVAPKNPAVPGAAPGALRLPIVEVH